MPALNAASISDARLAEIFDSAQPAVFDGLADIFNLVSFLEGDSSSSVVLDQSPWSWVPTFRRNNNTVVRPAQLVTTVRAALELLRRPEKQRQFSAYIRHQSLDALPTLRATLQSSRAYRLVGARVKLANLWLGDGSLGSALHFDGFDNLLMQISGAKEVLLLPPRQASSLGFGPFEEHRYVFDGGGFTGTEPTGEGAHENLSPLVVGERSPEPGSSRHGHGSSHLLSDALAEIEQREVAQPLSTIEGAAEGALVCRLAPGQSLFIPALWSHAVVSSENAVSTPATAAAAAAAPPPAATEAVAGEASSSSTLSAVDATAAAAAAAAAAATAAAAARGEYGGGADHAASADQAASANEAASAAAHVSSTCESDSSPHLNAALNIWYVRDTDSVRRALSSGAHDFPQAHQALGANLHELGRYSEAASAHTRAIDLRRPEVYFDAYRGELRRGSSPGLAAHLCSRSSCCLRAPCCCLHAPCCLRAPCFRCFLRSLLPALAAPCSPCSLRCSDSSPLLEPSRAWEGLGLALMESGHVTRAEKALRTAALARPTDA